MQIEGEGQYMLIISENGLGKRIKPSEFSMQNRGGKGNICYKINDKTGCIVGALSVDDGDEIMLINTQGVIIRISVDDISVLGRYAAGVKLVNLDAGTNVASFTRITRDMIEEDEDEDEEDPEELDEDPDSDDE